MSKSKLLLDLVIWHCVRLIDNVTLLHCIAALDNVVFVENLRDDNGIDLSVQ